MKVPIISRLFEKRRLLVQKKRYETLLKTYLNMRAQQHYYPEMPEVLPYPQNENALIAMSRRVAVLRATHENLKTEMFRVPPVLKHKFEAKCPRCGAEYQQYKKFCENPLCTIQGIRTYPPSLDQKKMWDDIKDRVNDNGQSLMDIAKTFTEYMLMTDNPWVVISWDYVVNELTGVMEGKKVREITHTPANTMRLIQDEYGKPGGLFWTCIEHRDVLYPAENKLEPCPFCGKPLYEVTAVSVILNQPATQSIRESIDKPYINGEWYHDPYFTETITYGVSNVYTLWILSSSLYYMDELENSTYKHGRPPKSLLIFNTFNPESLHAQMIDEFEKCKTDRGYQPKIAFPNEGKGNPATVLNLMPSEAEIQTLEHRRDIRERIAALYGMSPFMLADVSVGGGLNNEGMQLTIMLRRLESMHQWIESGLFQFALNCYGITDWVLSFPPLKEEDRMAVLERKKQNLQMMGEILNRGGDYRIIDDTDWQFEMIGKIGKLDQGAMGQGYKDIGGSGWDPRDWQKQDSSFAFSKSVGVSDIVSEFGDDLAVISGLGNYELLIPAWEGMIDRFRDYVIDVMPRWIREGLTIAGRTSIDAEITQDGLSRLRSLYDPTDAFARLREKLYPDFLTALSSSDYGRLRELLLKLSFRLDNIERTEETAFVNMGTSEAYRIEDPEDEVLDYDWIGPDYTEGRSTKVCDAIKNQFLRVRGAYGRVSLEDAERIIAEEGCKTHDDEKAFCLGRYLTPHYLCRHRLLARSAGMAKTMVYIVDPSRAPAGVNVIQGPRGGYYYDTDDVEDDTEEEEEHLEGPDQTPDDGERHEDGNGSTSEQGKDYRAMGVRGDGGEWGIKFYEQGEEKKVEEAMEQAGYEVKEGVSVEIKEAVPVGE